MNLRFLTAAAFLLRAAAGLPAQAQPDAAGRAVPALEPGSPARVVEAAGIARDDDETLKIKKLLFLLNNRRWLHDRYPHPGNPGYGRLSAREKDAIGRLLDAYKAKSLGPPGSEGESESTPYHLDSKRTVEQMIAERIGGSCGTIGLVAGHALAAAGFPRQSLRVVGAVSALDYAQVCPDGKGRARSRAANPARGHVFILFDTPAGAVLLNTTAPLGPPGAPIQRELDERLLASPLEMAPFLGAEEIAARLAAGEPVAVPDPSSHFPSLVAPPDGFPKRMNWEEVRRHMAGLAVFRVWRLDEFPVHDGQGRLDLVASGKLGDGKCRFDPREVFASLAQPGPDSR